MESLTRGDLVIASFAGDYGKPRPALVVQADVFSGLESVALLPLTSDLQQAPASRIMIEPDAGNGLRRRSQVMVDKIVAVPHRRVGDRIGYVQAEQLATVDIALRHFLGLR